VQGIRLIWGAILALTVPALAACGAGGGDARIVPATPQITIGARAELDEVEYVAFDHVGLDRLPRDRVEPGGEARFPSQARRVPAWRLKGNPTAAVRYTEDGPRGWLAWQPVAVLYARQDLARRERVPAAQIQTVDVTHAVWEDSCLGGARPGETCAAATVPGFRVILRLAGRLYEYHTDRADRVVPVAG
jgi:hypothetical protein